MSTWIEFSGDDSQWQVQVAQLDRSTYLHDNEWSWHLNTLGWCTCRWSYAQDNRIIALLQGFLKRYSFGVGVLWFPDWIIGDYSLSGQIGEVLRQSLGLRYLYIRVRSHHLLNNKEVGALTQSFVRPTKAFDSGLTMHLDLTNAEIDWHKKLSKNWRHNLKRSNKLDYEVCRITDVNIVTCLYNELSRVKSLKELLSSAEIKSLMKVYNDKLLVIGAKTPDGVVQAVRGAIIRGDQAIDIFAAANAFSRKHYLSYALCWKLINRCKSLGCNNFDFSGVNPENNIGVYNFKKGTGAELVRTLGEFEWSNSFIIRWLVNFIIRWRR